MWFVKDLEKGEGSGLPGGGGNKTTGSLEGGGRREGPRDGTGDRWPSRALRTGEELEPRRVGASKGGKGQEMDSPSLPEYRSSANSTLPVRTISDR